MQPGGDLYGGARAQIGDGAGGVGGIGQGTLVGALVGEVDLHLRHQFGVGLIAQAEADIGLVAGAEVGVGLVELVGDGELVLAIDEGVKILADGMVVVGAQDQVGTAGAGLQAGIEGLAASSIGAGGEEHRVTTHGRPGHHILPAVIARGELDAQLHAQIVGRQPALVAGDELDIADAAAGGAAEIVGSQVGRAGIAIGGMAAIDVGNGGGDIPFRRGRVADAQVGVAVDGLVLDLLRAACVIDGGGLAGGDGAAPRAQLALVDEGLVDADAPAGLGGIAHGGIAAERAAAGGAGQRQGRRAQGQRHAQHQA